MSISSTLVQRAEIAFHEAAEPLRPFVGCFWVMTAQPNATIRVVPDGSTAISIQLQNDQTAEWCLRGPLVRPDERRFTSEAQLVGIRLRPGVAFLLCGTPAHTMVGRRIELTREPAFRDLVAESRHPLSPERCIDLLQRFLVQRLAAATLNSVVADALTEIEHAHGCIRATEVAARCRVSSRHLHRLMRTWVGYGPKYYANIIRFQSTLHSMEHLPRPNAAALANDNGYFDQAHLTLDVARFGGGDARPPGIGRCGRFFQDTLRRPPVGCPPMRSGIGKAVLGIVAGLVVWIAVVAVAGFIMRSSWPAYARVADAMTFTWPMMLARLSIGALATLAAGWVTTAIAPQPMLMSVIPGLILLAAFIPQHIALWSRFPIWYHLIFLSSLVPLTYLGGATHRQHV